MLRLNREVRFGIHEFSRPSAPGELPIRGSNGFAASPALLGVGHFFAVTVTLRGETSERTGCVRDIQEIDAAVRMICPMIIRQWLAQRTFDGGEILLLGIFAPLKAELGESVERVTLALSPYLKMTAVRGEVPMIRLSQTFEFSASHRLHNPALSDEENRRIFGKCNNPHGHGHNYIVEVTLLGRGDNFGQVMALDEFEQIVSEEAIKPLDHKNLNVEIAEFKELIPSVENIARVVFQRLKPRFAGSRAKLASVTVWETPKTSAEYSE
jgi:6-pyruvoyltetrahydropterin/6-carboxytetrahydropterin synthase